MDNPKKEKKKKPALLWCSKTHKKMWLMKYLNNHANDGNKQQICKNTKVKIGKMNR